MEEKTELELLKERADQLGLSYHPKIGLDRLKAKVDAKLNGKDEEPKDTEEVEVETVTTTNKTKEEDKPMTQGQLKAKMRREASVLKRVRISCMNPNKKDWEGEIISAGNSVIGQFKKYVPFNNEEGYHIPQVIYNYLKEKECQIFVTVKGPTGEKIRQGKQIKEFAIEDLPPLTKKELEELARKQAMGNTVD